MNAAYIPALAALAGSAIGAGASFATTWLTQNFQDRIQRQTQALARRERLYGQFIEEASTTFAEALSHELAESSRMVNLYAIRSKLRLFAPDNVTEAADLCMERIVETYRSPKLSIQAIQAMGKEEIDFLRHFTECCRDDLL